MKHVCFIYLPSRYISCPLSLHLAFSAISATDRQPLGLSHGSNTRRCSAVPALREACLSHQYPNSHIKAAELAIATSSRLHAICVSNPNPSSASSPVNYRSVQSAAVGQPVKSYRPPLFRVVLRSNLPGLVCHHYLPWLQL